MHPEGVTDMSADEYMPTEIIVEEAERKRIELLRLYGEYDAEGAYPFEDVFVPGGEKPAVLEKYGYSTYIAGVGADDDAFVFRMLDFVCCNFGHSGNGGCGEGCGIAELIEFCERGGGRMNCRGLSMLLASLLRLNGIRARAITCMPYEEPFSDCHVVVDCLLPSGSRVMLDPTFHLYYRDADGEYVSVRRLRALLAEGGPLFPNEKAGYNGGAFDAKAVREYMIKNMFRFSRCIISKNGYDRYPFEDGSAELIPKGYPTGRFPADRRARFTFNDEAFWRI